MVTSRPRGRGRQRHNALMGTRCRTILMPQMPTTVAVAITVAWPLRPSRPAKDCVVVPGTKGRASKVLPAATTSIS
eukprot:7118154-Lingulodinium_polyedra.AAC.1